MSPLVTTAWLAEHLAAPDLRIFDATIYLPGEAQDAAANFAQGRIPGARFFDLDAIADQETDLPHMVPSAGRFERLVVALGVCGDDRVVFYDQKGLFSAARGWWLMRLFGHTRAAVLDGGLPKWRGEGRALETGTPAPAPPGNFRADLRATRLRGLGDMLHNTVTGAELVLDARPAGRFHGTAPEPRPGLASGHIPGAASLPASELLAADHTMRPVEALRARLAAAGADGSRPVVTSCGTGVTAAILTLGMVVAGLPDGALYDGGMDRMGGATRDAEGGVLSEGDAEGGVLSKGDAEGGVLSKGDAEGGVLREGDAEGGVLREGKPGLATVLAHAGRAGTKAHGFVNPPVHRGSTVLYEDMAQRRAHLKRRFDQALTYGTQGSATHHALEDVVAAVEGGTRCQIFSTGLAACTTPLLGYLGAGEHCLMPDSVYGPVRIFCDTMLKRMGVATTYYRADCDADALAGLFLPETRVLYVESPGSHSFEVQDVPALAAVAHARGAAVLMDNTWGIHAFQPFAHGVDVSIQALTKYAGGHSDVLIGSATVADERHWKIVRDSALVLGQYASPDDCWLTLRGLRTMAIRLERQAASGLAVAAWFAGLPEVARVLHPALPGAPGHDLWRRDFTGACSLFGVEFAAGVSVAATHRFVDALELFGIGASWGGFESLALPTTGFVSRTAGGATPAGPMVRFHIGLEDPADLIADLALSLPLLRPA